MLTNHTGNRRDSPPGQSPSKPVYGSRIPVELCEQVIDYLHDCPSALSECSLICRTWASYVRTFRFRHISLRPGNMAAFRRLLKGSPIVGTYVKSLSILFSDSRSILSVQLQLRDTLDAIFDSLIAVEVLRLDFLIVTPAMISTLSRLSSVRRLEIGRGCMATSAEAMTAVTRSFALTQLAIRGVPFAHPLAVRVGKPAQFILDKFRRNYPFEGDDSSTANRFIEPFYNYLLRNGELVFQQSDFRAAIVRGFAALTEGVTSSLEDLSINLGEVCYIDAAAFGSGASECARLCNISFYNFSLMDRRSQWKGQWLADFLPAVHNTSVRTITFHVLTRREIPETTEGQNPHEALATALASSNLPNLEHIIFVIDPEQDRKDVMEQSIREAFRALDGRGILSVYAA